MQIKEAPLGYFIYNNVPHINLGVEDIETEEDGWTEQFVAVDLTNFEQYCFDPDDEVEPCNLHSVVLLLNEESTNE